MKVAVLEELVRDQLTWVINCGGSLEEYIRRYGDPDRPRKHHVPMYGTGGTQIFKADVAELERRVTRLERHQHAPALNPNSILHDPQLIQIRKEYARLLADEWFLPELAHG